MYSPKHDQHIEGGHLKILKETEALAKADMDGLLKSRRRVKSGIAGFDELVEGGLLNDRVYIICGPPGSGKTTFGCQYLAYGAIAGERGMYVTMMEDPRNIIMDMSSYPFNILNHVKTGRLFFMDFGANFNPGVGSSIEFPTMSQLFAKVREFVESKDVKRLVIDSISQVKFVGADLMTEKKQMVEFVRKLESLDCTTILLSEMLDPDKYAPEHFLVHGVIFLYNFLSDGIMTRAVQILKMRGTRHESNMRKLEFTENGLRISGQI
ncbi:MAG: ATPase domain-containing protein [Candidatus Hydrothermarchaeales archaeon]